MSTQAIPLSQEQVAAFCQQWQIIELALFGSALRADFRPDSDIDVMVRFHPEARPTLFDMVRIKGQLQALLGRPVDLVSRQGIEASRNAPRREAILQSAKVVYAA